MPIALHVGPRVAQRVDDTFGATPFTRFGVTALTPTIGAEITGVDLAQPIDDELHAELHRALLEWKVLFFRDQEITREQHRAVAERWGELERHPFYAYVNPGQTDADVVTLAKDAMTGGYENEWHSDVSWRANPSMGAILRAVELPAVGGDTLWADACAAYDCLPAALKDRIEHLTAVHDWRRTFGLAMPADAVAELATQFPPMEHPIVRIHPETGRRLIYVNPIFTQCVVGVSETESDAILAQLYFAMSRPEHQVRFRWTVGAVAFWDNRATQHYASSDYHPQRRVMDRISIIGEVPVGPA